MEINADNVFKFEDEVVTKNEFVNAKTANERVGVKDIAIFNVPTP